MSVSPLSQATAGVASVMPSTADFRRFEHVRSLKHPDIRVFVAEAFAQGVRFVFLVAEDAVLLILNDGQTYGYEDAVHKMEELAPVLSYAINELAGEYVQNGHAFAAAVTSVGCAFGVEWCHD